LLKIWDENMPTQEQIKLVEASLFVAGRPITEEDLIELTEVKEKKELDKIIEILSKNLEERNSFIEIVKIQDQYMMRIKSEIKKNLGDLQTRKTIPDEYMKLMAIIAMKQPIKTSLIRKIYRVSNIKEILKELERKGFIQIKTEKRVKYVSTTPHFAAVFNLDPQNIKTSILKMVTHRLAQQAIKPPKIVKKKDKTKKQVLTEVEKKEIDKRYFELIKRLEIERKKEQKRLEEEAKRKAEVEALKEKLGSDPMASLLKKEVSSVEVREAEVDIEDKEIDEMLEALEEEELEEGSKKRVEKQE